MDNSKLKRCLITSVALIPLAFYMFPFASQWIIMTVFKNITIPLFGTSVSVFSFFKKWKVKTNGLIENCFTEHWGRRHGQNDRVKTLLCIATLRDRKRFVCLFVFFKSNFFYFCKIQTVDIRKISFSRKTLNQKKRPYPGKFVWFCISITAPVNG